MNKNQIVKIDNLTIEDFADLFTAYGFTRDNDVFYKSRQIVVGESVINGQRSVQTAEERSQFKWIDFHGTMDDTPIAGFEFSLQNNGHTLGSEICYMTRDDVETFVKFYTGNQNGPKPVSNVSNESDTKTE